MAAMIASRGPATIIASEGSPKNEKLSARGRRLITRDSSGEVKSIPAAAESSNGCEKLASYEVVNRDILEQHTQKVLAAVVANDIKEFRRVIEEIADEQKKILLLKAAIKIGIDEPLLVAEIIRLITLLQDALAKKELYAALKVSHLAHKAATEVSHPADQAGKNQ